MAKYISELQQCNDDPDMHESLMQLSGKVAGRQKVILGKYEEQMDVPIDILSLRPLITV